MLINEFELNLDINKKSESQYVIKWLSDNEIKMGFKEYVIMRLKQKPLEKGVIKISPIFEIVLK